MKVKVYRSGTRMATTVQVGGHNVHVSFQPTSDGGSTLTVTNPALQEALERSWLYGRWFRLVQEHEEADPTPEAEEKPDYKLRKVEVSSESEAKDYLIEHCGALRSQLRSRVQIKAAAEKAGIYFKGIGA